jgi:hypothetical protein
MFVRTASLIAAPAHRFPAVSAGSILQRTVVVNRTVVL